MSAVVIPSAASRKTAVVTVPSEGETYAGREKTPSVKFEREVIVGSELPNTIVVHRVPKFDGFLACVVVNNRRVIIDAKTRRVVEGHRVTTAPVAALALAGRVARAITGGPAPLRRTPPGRTLLSQRVLPLIPALPFASAE